MSGFLLRSTLLLGAHNIHKLQESHVMVVGLGGVGSYSVEALARSGIGHMSLVDRDRVEISNINRQIPALHSTVGRFKTDVLAGRIRDINPSISVDIYTIPYNQDSSQAILSDRPGFVVDAIDSISDKLHLLKTCFRENIPVISSMGMANRIDPACIRITDISDTHTCPVARVMRRELKKDGIESGIEVVFSTESPFPIPRQEGEAASLGSLAFVPSVAGLFAASHVVRRICGLY